MKKYLATGIAVIVLIAIVGTFDKLLIATMHLVDAYGSATGTTTVEVIDGLNDIYYSLYE